MKTAPRRWRSVKSEEFDQAFDDGEDVTASLDISAARRPGLEQRPVNADLPTRNVTEVRAVLFLRQ
jgi:hypothetical protein